MRWNVKLLASALTLIATPPLHSSFASYPSTQYVPGVSVSAYWPLSACMLPSRSSAPLTPPS